jgi:hypothetical protein
MLPTEVARDRLDELRASDADRQQVSQLLQTACAEGRLTMDEFSERVERARLRQSRCHRPGGHRRRFRGAIYLGSKSLKLGGRRPVEGAARLLVRGMVMIGSATVRDLW